MSYNRDNSLLSPQTFQTLIRERTKERKNKAKEKCQKGLKQIAEMKSREGVDPLELFPEPVWLNILNDLRPEDLGALYDIHPFFQNILDSNRIRDILFPMALPFLLDHIKNNSEVHMFRDDISDSDLAPFMKLRKVSKSLKNGVDRWFETKINEELHKHPAKSPDLWNKVPGMMFNLHRDHATLQNLIKIHGGNPETLPSPKNRPPRSCKAFFLRSIDLVISLYHWDHLRENVDPEYQEIIFKLKFQEFMYLTLKLLELVGDQIWNFQLRIFPVDFLHGIEFSPINQFGFLLECCKLMPNLKRLGVYFQSEGWGEVNTMPQDAYLLFEEIPFPTLEKLERISLEQDRNIGVTPIIYDAILKANPHVKMLKFRMEDDLMKNVSSEILEALNLEYFSWRNMTLQPKPSRNTFTCKKWPLRCLKIQMTLPNLIEVFQLLEQVPALEKVNLKLINVKIGKGAGFLKLPNLKYFTIHFGGQIDYEWDDLTFFFSLEFLLYSKKLRRIKWSHFVMNAKGESENVNLQRYLEFRQRPGEGINFMCGKGEIKSSIIWKAFPELELIEVEEDGVPGSGKVIWQHYRP